MTATLTQARCFLHSAREAVCRCPSCQRMYCRECVVEHAGVMLCETCLLTRTRPVAAARRRSWPWRAVGVVFGLLLTWLTFYYAGQALLRLPDNFHSEFAEDQ